MIRSITKRAVDVAGAFVGLVVLSPLLIATWFLVRRNLGSPAIFSEWRPGRGSKPFRMMKFRSMIDARGPGGEELSDEERLTPFGRRLRETSLDELPELWNVLRGEMSLVGPRPLLMDYLPLYSAEQGQRHELRPGITGWAQVNGRNTIDWHEKFELDVWYVDNHSILLDFKIIWMTVHRVVARQP